MMATEACKPQKFQKTKKFFKAAWGLTKAFVKISPLVAAPLFAQEKDTIKTADEIALKPSLSAKAVVRVYEGGKSEGAGLGFDTGIEVRKVAAGITFTGLKEGSAIKCEEASIWAALPAGSFTVIPYVYRDLYFKAPDATFGMAVKGLGAKIGIDVSKGFWVAYGKLPFEGVTLGGAVIGWDGKLQKFAIDFNTNATVGKITVSGEARQAWLLSGGSGTLQFRVSLSTAVF
ncbi:MAG: hypothetical protein QW568_01025 [Candidatus Anstonellaceae archaeon]